MAIKRKSVRKMERAIPYRAHGAAWEILFGPHRRDREIVLVGPAGTGKSRAILEKLHLAALKYPGCRILMVRKTRASMTDTVLVTFENKVLLPGSTINDGAKRPGRLAYSYPNGSEIVVGGMDKPEKVLSSEYDIIYFAELIEGDLDDWEILMSRLRNGVVPYQQIIGDTNPGHPAHWLKKRIDTGGITALRSRHEDNPLLFSAETRAWTPVGQDYLATLNVLTGHRRKRLLLGEWAASEGSRFPDLCEAHRFDFGVTFPEGIPPTWRVIVGKDYGKHAPYAALWMAQDHAGHWWVFREDYRAGLSPSEQAARVLRLTRKEERIAQVRVDPSVYNAPPTLDPWKREPSISTYWEAAYRADTRFGAMVPGYNRSRMHALETLDELLSLSNGGPKLHIDNGCEHLWDELVGAIWDRGGKEDIAPECPDHAITALYYGCHTHVLPPSPPRVVDLDATQTNQFARMASDSERAFLRGRVRRI